MSEEFIKLDDMLKLYNPNLSSLTRQRYATNFLLILKKLDCNLTYLIEYPNYTIDKLKELYPNENTLKSKIISIISILKYLPTNNSIYLYQQCLNDINQHTYIEYIATKTMKDFMGDL